MAILYGTSTDSYQKYGENVKKLFHEAMAARKAIEFEYPGKGTVKIVIPNTDTNITRAQKLFDDSLKFNSGSVKKPGDDPRYLTVDGIDLLKVSSNKKITDYISNSRQGPKGVYFTDINKNQVKTAFLFNRGDVSEGILAAAITARFINKNEEIQVSHIEAVMEVLDKQKRKGITKISHIFDGPNKEPPVSTPENSDKVHCDISLKAADINALLTLKLRKSVMKGHISSAVLYVNKGSVAEKAKAVYENKKVDNIYVDSDGIGNQKGTKIDLRVKINDSRYYDDLNISLKAGDTKNFGNVSGNEFKTQQDLWGRMGVPIENIEEEYNKLLQEGKESTAILKSYKYAAKHLQEIINQPKSEFYKNFANFIRFHATRDDPTVVLVQLKNQRVAKAFSFENIEEKIKNYTFLVEVTEAESKPLGKMGLETTTNPTLSIRSIQGEQQERLGDNKSDFLSVRSTINPKNIQKGKYYRRNYIEKGKEMEQLFGIGDYESDPEAKDVNKKN